MKVVILAGGKGTRLSEYTKKIPKPMVKVGKKTMIENIMEIYEMQGFDDFVIAAGYKYKIIQKYFAQKKFEAKNIKIINTGISSMTGLRIKKLQKILKKETFFLTYGDGLSNINIKKLVKFHRKKKYIATMTVVHPPARFGEVSFNNNRIVKFEEKPQLQKGWINGGFFVFEPKIFKILTYQNTMLERDALQKLVKKKQISAYPHKGFWYCMDNVRDKVNLEKMIKYKSPPWLKINN